MDFNFNINDINYLPWLIPVGPLLAFAIIALITNRAQRVPATQIEAYGGYRPDYPGLRVPVVTPFGRVASIVVGMSGAIAAFLIAWTVFFDAYATAHFGEGDLIFASAFDWMATGLTSFRMGVLVDPLTAIMLFMVPLAVVCIFIYSIGYMAHDPRQGRFFALISLFAGAMLTLVVADNLLLLFVGWEIMGLCSYLLIGFWYEKKSAYSAAIKAFTTTRVADVIMLLGIAYLYFETGTLSFREILYNQAVLDSLAGAPAIIFGGWGLSAAGLIGVFLIIGTVGKSAQFPLHIWLPDAMEGPTPVSAMIHAAAMVSAGIYAIIRMYPLFEAGGHPHDGEFTTPLLFMAIIGSFTALFAATIAVAQNDVKKVLAYSTISQLGFMMAALGIGAYVAAAFHLITHAFFKALLFMASGAVIHAMEHGEHHVHDHAHGHGHGHGDSRTTAELLAEATALRERRMLGSGIEADVIRAEAIDAHDEDHAHDDHDTPAHDPHAHEVRGHDDHPEGGFGEHGAAHPFDPQDMMNMGGLRRTIPVTALTFAIGGLSLAGFPLLTAGFWSKDEILAESFLGLTEGFGPHALVFIMLCLAAFLTAFYTARQLCLTFLGEPRTEEAEHANLGGAQSIVSITMQLPLIILAFFAIVAGFVGVPSDFPIFGAIFSPDYNRFHHFIGPALLVEPPTIQFNWIPVLFSFGVALGGLGVGYLVYGRRPLTAGQPDPLIETLGPIHTLLKNKYYIDDLVQVAVVQPSQWFSRNVVSEFVDRGVIDGFLHLLARIGNFIGDLLKTLNLWLIDGVSDGIPAGIGRFGVWFRQVQTGRVQQYLLLVLVAALLIGLLFIVAANFVQAG
jgi:NADH-quinone oxidoreductase subunit L